MKTKDDEALELERNIKKWAKEACAANGVNKHADEVKLEHALKAILKGDEPVYKALGISDEEMEKRYALAYRLYQMGNYKDALVIFRNSSAKDGWNPRYSFGIAACYHQLKEYEDAAGYYMFTSYLNPTDPVPAFHMYDCYMKMFDYWAAGYALAMVLNRTEDKPIYRTMHHNAQLRMDQIRELVKKEKTKS